MNDIVKLGIIAGNGMLPIEIANFYKQNNYLCYIAGIDGYFDHELFKKYSDMPYNIFYIGAVKEIINYFQSNDVKQIVLAGAIKRPNLKSIKVDLLGAKLISKILANKFIGDDTILRTITKFLEEYNFEVISMQDLYSRIIKYENKLTVTKLEDINKHDIIDIKLGINVLNALGNLDVGQSVIVEDGYVIGIEAAEGTDELIMRCATLRKKNYGGVLIKLPKINQDMKVDLPTIGDNTVNLLAKYKYNGLAYDFKGSIILNLQKTLGIADLNNIFLFDINNLKASEI